eukprot:2547936-Prymnesium_polylepis.2
MDVQVAIGLRYGGGAVMHSCAPDGRSDAPRMRAEWTRYPRRALTRPFGWTADVPGAYLSAPRRVRGCAGERCAQCTVLCACVVRCVRS